jgi:hypothetical protein
MHYHMVAAAEDGRHHVGREAEGHPRLHVHLLVFGFGPTMIFVFWAHIVFRLWPSHVLLQPWLQFYMPSHGNLICSNMRPIYTDLHQFTSNLNKIMTKIHVEQMQVRHFFGKQKNCGALHNLAKGGVKLKTET